MSNLRISVNVNQSVGSIYYYIYSILNITVQYFNFLNLLQYLFVFIKFSLAFMHDL